jgi:hypothetical protein
MKMRSLLLVAAGALRAWAANPAELDTLRQGHEAATAPYVQRAEQDYLQKLDTLMRQFGAAARIEDATAVKAEMDRVRSKQPVNPNAAGKLPDAMLALRRNYETALATNLRPARQAYAQKLDTLMKRFGAAGRIDDAALVQTELEAVRRTADLGAASSGGFLTTWKRPDETVAREMIGKGEVLPISSRREDAYVIGRLPMRAVIYVQYVEGKWKASGKIASDSPDDPRAQYKELSRLAIVNKPASGRSKVIALVPPNTKDEPYFYVADHELENVMLRINDNDGDFTKNPDGGVKYRVYVQRP